MVENKFALLIDSENISSKYIGFIFDELTKYGTITYKRIYGDWTNPQSSRWRENLLENAISPIQQFSNSTGKNATDSTLIIDAMDILYTNNIDGFCIVSSDGDFTRLASRLRESGKNVIGMGESKTPKSFRAACTKFINLELLSTSEDDVEKENIIKSKEIVDKKEVVSIVNKGKIVQSIIDIVIESENNGVEIHLGEIGSKISKKYQDFDVRNYGYSRLSKFIEEIDCLQCNKKSTSIIITMKDNKHKEDAIRERVIQVVSSKKSVGLSELSNVLHSEYKNFNIKDYGYSTFSKFVQSIKGLEILDNKDNRKRVKYIMKTK